MTVNLELAIIRYSVVCCRWQSLAAGFQPELNAFLAGWCCRVIGADKPENCGMLKESFNAGWEEARAHIVIAERESSVASGDPDA